MSRDLQFNQKIKNYISYFASPYCITVCGIAGVFHYNGKSAEESLLHAAVDCLKHRGPDSQKVYINGPAGLAHARLSIIDPDPASDQPFLDETGRYVLVFNGEIFNYIQLKKQLEAEGICFRTRSDTEVLLKLLIKKGSACLPELNGFFALAFYDSYTGALILARDKFGVKPLFYYKDDNFLAFASELKSLSRLGIPYSLNYNSLPVYFQLNYIPSEISILNNVYKLKQGSFAETGKNRSWTINEYYSIQIRTEKYQYINKLTELEKHLSTAVEERLVSDVPIGVFLSGGVDSSVIALLARKHKPDIHSFSVGFNDHPRFDESQYAEKVARFLGLSHHTFQLSDQMMLDNIGRMLEYTDEPFADSSAIAAYNLCLHTKEHVTVALTGDGADEVFGGYNKHLAEVRIRKRNLINKVANLAHPLLNILPGSRGAGLGNTMRKIKKYSHALKLSEQERYWQLCSFCNEQSVFGLFSEKTKVQISLQEYKTFRELKTGSVAGKDLNHLLKTDVEMVLEGDMLVKTDRMSMANSMELRNPFLDSRVVDFAFRLNEKDKNDGKTAKKILKDTFRPYLPAEVFTRKKTGFEVPLTQWLRKDLHYLTEMFLNETYLSDQGIFNTKSIAVLRKRLYSDKPEDVALTIWALLNFQIWDSKFRK